MSTNDPIKPPEKKKVFWNSILGTYRKADYPEEKRASMIQEVEEGELDQKYSFENRYMRRHSTKRTQPSKEDDEKNTNH